MPSRFWDSIGLVFVAENSRPGRLRPDIRVLCKRSLADSSTDQLASDQLLVIRYQGTLCSYMLGFVHSHTAYLPRRRLWDDILNMRTDTLCIIGDFNVVSGTHERNSDSARRGLPTQEF
ncbi:hypothetical protein ACS0TY_035632 [Phlomoides rotata]